MFSPRTPSSTTIYLLCLPSPVLPVPVGDVSRTQNQQPCGDRACNVCSICTHGFVIQGNVGGTARRTNRNLRYGDGLYFSSVSGKANDYAQGSEKVGGGRLGLATMLINLWCPHSDMLCVLFLPCCSTG